MRFLKTWAVALVAIMALVAGVNIVVNPYDRFGWPRIPGVNVLKPKIRDHAALTKAYQIERARPVTVVLGTSRPYLGIDSRSPAWPASYQPVYNYGIPGTTMRESLLRLREAWSTGHLRHAVVFLDLPDFFTPDSPSTGGEDERRLIFLDNRARGYDSTLQRIDDAFLSVFTLAAFSDSVTTILSQGGGDRVLDLRPDGTATDADFANAARAEGMNAVFAQKDAFNLARVSGIQHNLADWHGPMPNMGIIREMIRFCREHHMTLTLVLASSHVDDLEIYRRAGLWPRIEQIKVELADLVAETEDESVTVWDFVEYAPYTTETLPMPNDRHTAIRWFWEPVHFKHALGDVILRRVFSGDPADFGVTLTPVTVEARNRSVRERQRAFMGWHLACEADPQIRCVPPALPAEASR